jgi:putative endonuclease
MHLPFYVYIILCADGSFYTGYTKNVDERLRQHRCGKGARYTRMHKPERLIYTELLDSRAQAMKREKVIKKMSHQQKLELANHIASSEDEKQGKPRE